MHRLCYSYVMFELVCIIRAYSSMARLVQYVRQHGEEKEHSGFSPSDRAAVIALPARDVHKTPQNGAI